MAVKPVQVDESEKDQPGVEAVTVSLGGRDVTVYMKTVMSDDLDEEITEDVREVEFLWPEDCDLVVDTGEKDADGQPVTTVRGAVSVERMVIDLGPESRQRLRKALEPFYDQAREVPEEGQAHLFSQGGARTRTATSTAPSSQRSAWVKRVKAWLAEQGQEVPARKLGKEHEAAYVKANPNDPRPE